MLQMLHGDAVNSQCEGLGQAAASLAKRLDEFIGGRKVPEPAFFRETPKLVERMYVHLDEFREGKILPFQETIEAPPPDVAEPLPVEEALEVPPVAEVEEPAAEAAFEETIEAVPPVQETAPGEIDPELVSIFLGEADELMESLDRQFAALERDAGSKEPLAEVARALHTLKGGARMCGQEGIGTVAHKLESLIEHVAQGRVARDAALHARLHHVMDGLYRLLDAVKRGEKPDEAPVLAELEGDAGAPPVAQETIEMTMVEPPPPPPRSAPKPPAPPVAVAPGLTAAAVAAMKTSEMPAIAYDADLAQIFASEAAELMESLETSLTAWQSDAHNEEALREVQRALHTLKGGARLTVPASILRRTQWPAILDPSISGEFPVGNLNNGRNGDFSWVWDPAVAWTGTQFLTVFGEQRNGVSGSLYGIRTGPDGSFGDSYSFLVATGLERVRRSF